MNRPLGKRQKSELEAHLSRRLTKRDQPVLSACLGHIMPNSLEMAIEPDLRELMLGGLAGAEAVYEAYRFFEDSALAEIISKIMSERDAALEQLHDALATGQMMLAACAAGDLSRLGGKAEGLIFFGKFAENAVSDSQSRSSGGLERAKEQKAEIRVREGILTILIVDAVAAGGARNGWNSSWLARWMLEHWPSDGLSALNRRAGVRVIRDWVTARRKTHPDDFWIPAGSIPKQEGQVASTGATRCGSTRSQHNESHHPGVAA